MEKKDFNGYPFNNFIFEIKKRKYILNPLTNNKVLYDGVKGKEVRESLEKFFPEYMKPLDHLDNNIMEIIANNASPKTRANLHMANKTLEKIMVTNDPKIAIGKKNYEFFIRALQSLKSDTYLHCYFKKGRKFPYILVNINSNSKITIKIETHSLDNVLVFTGSMNNTFDIFKNVRSKEARKQMIHAFKNMVAIDLQYDKPLSDEWKAYIKSYS